MLEVFSDFEIKKWLVAATFLPVLDDGNLLYDCRCSLSSLDGLWRITVSNIVGRDRLQKLSHCYSFIYKHILGLLPSYICDLITLQCTRIICCLLFLMAALKLGKGLLSIQHCLLAIYSRMTEKQQIWFHWVLLNPNWVDLRQIPWNFSF